MRNCIIVSPYFPPSTLAGVHRARHLAKHLPAAGWKPTILCVDESCHEQRLDPELASLVPGTADIVKVDALDKHLSRRMGLGDVSLRAFFPLRRKLLELVADRHAEAVLITGSPYYPMLFARDVKRRFGTPVILDFQDPWVSAWGADQPVLSKAGVAHRLATILEPRALRHADYVTSVSEIQNRQMAAHYDWLDGGAMAAIPIGSDPEDYDALRVEGQGRPSEEKRDHVLFSYVGAFLPRAASVVDALMKGLARLRENRPDLYRRMRFQFIGTSNQASKTDRRLVLPIAEANGVADIVEEQPARIPYVDALRTLSTSDAILMIGSDEPHYTASKIYPGLMSGTPFLSLFHAESSAHRILSDAGGGAALCFRDEASLEALVPPIASALVELAEEPARFGTADPASYAAFTAANIARRYAEIFDQLAGEGRRAA